MHSHTVLIVDDHEPTRVEMRALVEAQPDLVVVAEAGTGEEAVRDALRFRPELVVMDVVLPLMNGVEATRKIVKEVRNVRVLAVSNHSEGGLVQAVLEAGALGYICKDHLFEELVSGLRAVYGRKQYLGRNIHM